MWHNKLKGGCGISELAIDRVKHNKNASHVWPAHHDVTGHTRRGDFTEQTSSVGFQPCSRLVGLLPPYHIQVSSCRMPHGAKK